MFPTSISTRPERSNIELQDYLALFGGGLTAPFLKQFGEQSDTGGGMLNPDQFLKDYNEQAQKLAEEQRIWSAEQAQKQMDFQERMSNTQYQRAVEDMKKAGLNPYMLMSGGAHSAGNVQGSMAQSQIASQYGHNDTLTRDMALLGFFSNMVNVASKLI